MKQFMLRAIRLYQRYLSPLTYGSCRFIPTCSEYTYQAIERYGIIVGLWVGFKRIIRCNPWNNKLYD